MLRNSAVLDTDSASPIHSVWRTFNAALTRLPLVALFFVCTAAAYGSFFAKWGFCGAIDESPCGLAGLLDGTARRPWVYRRLLPELATWLDSHLPVTVHDHLLQYLLAGNLGLHYSPAIAAVDQPAPTLLLFYYVYALGWLAFVGAAFLLWRIGLHATGDRVASALAAALFALVLPMFLTVGGNFYDFTELFFFALAAWIALTRLPFWLLLVAPVATYNKESFFFFLITLYPILAARFGWRRALGWTGAPVLLSGVVYWLVRAHYAGNPGGMVEFHLHDHLEYFRHFAHLWQFEFQYGLLAPRSFNIINIVLIVLLVRAGFKWLSPALKRYVQLALVINVPLFLLFCYPGELRNFSMLYVGLVVMLACALSHLLTEFYQRKNATPLSV